MATEKQSNFLIEARDGSADYTPVEFKSLEFRRGGKEEEIYLSWTAMLNNADLAPEKGTKIRVWIVYPNGERACLFIGKVVSHSKGKATILITAKGALP